MRIGTRRSALALAQAGMVVDLLGGGEIVPIVTRGDLRGDDGAPAAGEDKSRWVGELERALAAGEVDLAVHSAKDVPGELADGLALLGAPPRADAADVLCGADSLEALPAGARVGTGSIRRAAQLLATRADIHVVALRGNVDTRLRKLRDPSERLDAIVLARAGLQRLQREADVGAVLDPARFVPAPGQGVLALEGRADDQRARAAVAAITDAGTFACLLGERALAHELGASCHTPLGAYARADSGSLRVSAWVGMPDGSQWIADEVRGEEAHAAELGRTLANRLRAVGADALLRDAEEMAGVGHR